MWVVVIVFTWVCELAERSYSVFTVTKQAVNTLIYEDTLSLCIAHDLLLNTKSYEIHT